MAGDERPPRQSKRVAYDDENGNSKEEEIIERKLRKGRPLTEDEIIVFRSMVEERVFYRRLWKFLGYWSAYAGGAALAIWGARDFISAFWRALTTTGLK